MRRKKDDKRVLVSPRDNRQKKSRRQKIRRSKSNSMPYNKPKSNSKRSRRTVFLMILALVAFVIGAGIGISLSFENNSDDSGPQWVNVTKEMTSDLNDTEPVIYDQEVDDIDFNDNETVAELNLTTEPGY